MNQRYNDNNRGAAFPVRNKKSDNSPDFSGELDVNGVPYTIFIRKKKSKNQGKELLELSIIPKQQQPQYQPAQSFVPPAYPQQQYPASQPAQQPQYQQPVQQAPQQQTPPPVAPAQGNGDLPF